MKKISAKFTVLPDAAALLPPLQLTNPACPFIGEKEEAGTRPASSADRFRRSGAAASCETDQAQASQHQRVGFGFGNTADLRQRGPG